MDYFIDLVLLLGRCSVARVAILSNIDNFYMEKLHVPVGRLDRVDFDSAMSSIQRQPIKKKQNILLQ